MSLFPAWCWLVLAVPSAYGLGFLHARIRPGKTAVYCPRCLFYLDWREKLRESVRLPRRSAKKDPWSNR